MRGARIAAALGWMLLTVTTTGCGTGDEASPLSQLQQRLPVREGLNVIVISFDALRADVLGIYGDTRGLSPSIDAFAGESIVFENAYTVAPVTPTSFASAFTGLLPNRVFHAWNLAYPETVAKRFSEGGYRTAAFINNAQLTPERHFDAGFESYNFFRSRPDREILKASSQWLREHQDDRLFAWIHFLNPHSPYDYREMAAHLYEPGYEGEFTKTTGSRFATDDPAEVERIRQLYAGEVIFIDRFFRRLLRVLRETGLLERSLVVVTSDHGEEFKERGGFQHGRLNEEHVKIPLLFRHPDAPFGWRSDLLVSNVDLMPTFLGVAGIEHQGALDGRDLTRIQQNPDVIFGVAMTSGKERWASLRKGSHKLIHECFPERGQELFDLASDPGEVHSLHQEQPERVKEMLRELGTVLGGDPCKVIQAAVQGKDATVGLSGETVEALKALGYLGD